DSAQLNNITLPVPYRVIVLTCGTFSSRSETSNDSLIAQNLVNLYIVPLKKWLHFGQIECNN
ncbi:MAG: hypothetical protein IKJ59_14485, partial [Clostridia bacterium]|nr:hypothetical protein [Clostridia bacterium]